MPGASVGPYDPATERIIQAYLAFARSPSASFEVDIAAEFAVGRHKITFAGTGQRSDADAVEALTQTVDGQPSPMGMAVVGGRAYAIAGAGWEPQPGDSAAVMSSALLSLAQSLVLEDLGRDAAGAGHRLRVSAGLSLYPYQMAAIPDAHDLAERLELVVDDAGLPVVGVYTRSVSGTIDGTDGTASGRATFTFRGVGRPVAIALPSLVPGATMASQVASPPAAPAVWIPVALTYAPLRLEMPGQPVISSKTVPNPNLGPFLESDYRLTMGDGARYTAIESQYPQAYVDSRGAPAIAAEVVSIEARNLDATVVGQRPLVGTPQPGLDAVLATQSQLFRIRVYVVGRDVVELGVVGGPLTVGSADADRFLASLAAG